MELAPVLYAFSTNHGNDDDNDKSSKVPTGVGVILRCGTIRYTLHGAFLQQSNRRFRS